MSTIKAPFNFVPLNSQVIIPEWGPYISHDIPFEDGESGSLTITIKAHSPIFIRDSLKTQDGAQLFCQTNEGKHFIPGSSIRGMTRSLMEIMAYGKLEQMNQSRTAFRDFHNKELYRVSELAQKAFCGWLTRDNQGHFHLQRCGKPWRPHYDQIDRLFGTDFHNYFTLGRTGFGFNPKDDKEKSADFKYNRLYSAAQSVDLDVVAEKLPPKNNVDKRILCKIVRRDDGGDLGHQEARGTLVLTGHPSPRKEAPGKKGDGKVYDFIFLDKKSPSKPIPTKIFEDMQIAYLDNKKEDEQSKDWKDWKKKLMNGQRIPVFFHTKDDKPNGEVQSMGLSLLYKFAYLFSPYDLVKKFQMETGIDFPEAILGYTDYEHETEQSLKGRVQFGHAFAKEGTAHQAEEKVFEILSSPKPTFYPLYVKQDLRGSRINGEYQTYNDEDNSNIAGRKYYPIRKNGVKHYGIPSDAQNPERLTTPFFPLQEGAEFSFQIKYHNLKKVELGALISVLSFHKSDDCFHSMGLGKPLGYGKVKIEVEEIERFTGHLAAFEAYMTIRIKESWARSEPIKELLTMSIDQENGDQQLTYMSLKNGDFSTVKKTKEGLAYYSELAGIESKTAIPLAEDKDFEAAIAEKKRLENLYALKRDYKELVQENYQIQKAEFEQKLAAKKEALLNRLQAQKDKIRKRQVEAEKGEKRTKIEEKGPEWNKIKANTRQPIKDIQKVIRTYFNRIKKAEGLLLEEHHKGFEEKVLEIAERTRNKKLVEAWTSKPFEKNEYFEKITFWIGLEKAMKLYEKVGSIISGNG